MVEANLVVHAGALAAVADLLLSLIGSTPFVLRKLSASTWGVGNSIRLCTSWRTNMCSLTWLVMLAHGWPLARRQLGDILQQMHVLGICVVIKGDLLCESTKC